MKLGLYPFHGKTPDLAAAAALSVLSMAASLPALVKLGAAGFNEGNPKWGDMPRDKRSMASFIGLVGEGSGLYDPRCTVLPINVYLTDHKAETIKRTIIGGE